MCSRIKWNECKGSYLEWMSVTLLAKLYELMMLTLDWLVQRFTIDVWMHIAYYVQCASWMETISISQWSMPNPCSPLWNMLGNSSSMQRTEIKISDAQYTFSLFLSFFVSASLLALNSNVVLCFWTLFLLRSQLFFGNIIFVNF